MRSLFGNFYRLTFASDSPNIRTIFFVGKIMNRILSTALALALEVIPATELILNLPAEAGKPRWVKIWNRSAGQSALSVDQSSIKTVGRYRYFWTLSELSKPYKDKYFKGTAYYTKSYDSVDCQGKLSRTRDLIWLDRNYQAVYQIKNGEAGDLTKITPNLGYTKVINFVCSNQRQATNLPKSQPSTSKANPPKWVKVTSGDYATMYVNTASIRKVKNIRFFWRKLILNKKVLYEGTKEQKYGYLTYISLDCTGYIYRTRAFKVIGANDKVLYTLDPKKADDGLKQIFPGTRGDTEREIVCSR